MPRVALKKTDYLLSDFSRRINDRMRWEGITQEMIGKELGISQQAAGRRIRQGNFNTVQLMKLFKLLKFPQEEIVQYLGGLIEK